MHVDMAHLSSRTKNFKYIARLENVFDVSFPTTLFLTALTWILLLQSLSLSLFFPLLYYKFLHCTFSVSITLHNILYTYMCSLNVSKIHLHICVLLHIIDRRKTNVILVTQILQKYLLFSFFVKIKKLFSLYCIRTVQLICYLNVQFLYSILGEYKQIVSMAYTFHV